MSRSNRILASLDILVNGPPPPPISLIPLSRARLCVDDTCALVFSSDEIRACPACGSDSVPVSTLAEMTTAQVVEFRRLLSIRAREAFLRRFPVAFPSAAGEVERG